MHPGQPLARLLTLSWPPYPPTSILDGGGLGGRSTIDYMIAKTTDRRPDASIGRGAARPKSRACAVCLPSPHYTHVLTAAFVSCARAAYCRRRLHHDRRSHPIACAGFAAAAAPPQRPAAVAPPSPLWLRARGRMRGRTLSCVARAARVGSKSFVALRRARVTARMRCAHQRWPTRASAAQGGRRAPGRRLARRREWTPTPSQARWSCVLRCARRCAAHRVRRSLLRTARARRSDRPCPSVSAGVRRAAYCERTLGCE